MTVYFVSSVKSTVIVVQNYRTLSRLIKIVANSSLVLRIDECHVDMRWLNSQMKNWMLKKKKHLLIVMDKNVHLTSLVEVLTLAK